MFRINIKTLLAVFGISILIWFLLNIVVIHCYLSGHMGRVSESANHQYSLSVLFDGDLDLNNQILKSESRKPSDENAKFIDYSPNLKSWGGTIVWIPYYLYIVILDYLKLDKTNCGVTQADFAQALAAMIGFIVLLVNIYRIQETFALKKKTFLLSAAFLISTPSLWYVLIDPSESIITYLAVLSTVLLLLFDPATKNNNLYHWFLIGALSCLLVTIQNFGYFVFLGILSYVIVLKIKKLVEARECAFYFSGAALVLLFEILNSTLKFGAWITPLEYIKNDIFSLASRKFMIFDSLLGPSGILYMYPVYAMSLVGLLLLNYEIIFVKEVRRKTDYLLISLSVVAAINYLLSTNYWHPERDFLAAGFFESQLILLVGFLFLFKENKYRGYKIFFLVASFAWSLIITTERYANISSFGLRHTTPNKELFNLFFGSIKHIAWRFIGYYNFAFDISYSIFWLLLVFLVLYILMLFMSDMQKWKKLIRYFAAYMLAAFIFISLLNIYQRFIQIKGGLGFENQDFSENNIGIISYAPYVAFLQKRHESAIKRNKNLVAELEKNKIISYNKFILENIKTVPPYFQTENNLDGKSLLRQRENLVEIINTKSKHCTNEYEDDEPFD